MRLADFVPTAAMRATVRATLPRILSSRTPVRRQRQLIDLVGRVAVHPDGVEVVREVLGGRPAERVSHVAGDPGRAVLYLHGGAYLVGGAGTHRALATHLAAASGATVHLLDYRMAPESPYPAAVEDAVAAYRELLAAGVAVSVAGDSAGGGLALALMLRLREQGLPLPVAAALISPWVDLTLAHVHDDARDPMLRLDWLRQGADLYAGTADRTLPELSPLLADPEALADLPPLLVHGSSEEILLGDVERFVAATRSAGAEVDYTRLEGLWHVVHLHAGLVADSTRAVASVGSFLRCRG